MKIIGVGRNYKKHAEELGNPLPESPLIFFKPDTAVLRNNKDFYYPEYSKDIHYECELVVRISREGKYIQEKFATTYIDGIGMGLDLTARDIQQQAKEKGWPWTLAKGFNDSAPVSSFLPPDQFPDLQNIHFSLQVNGELRQAGHTAHMIFNVTYLIAYISQFITLKKGDLIFTGTPEGVGPIRVDDHMEGFLEGKKMLDFHIR